VNRKVWQSAALAALAWGCIGGSAASPEYLKDPAVRAAVEQNLKTSDPAEIRRRFGVLVDMLDKTWAWQYEPAKQFYWFRLNWVVEGAVMEFVGSYCIRDNCPIRKAVLVHNPEASKTWSFSNPFRNPAFDWLEEKGPDALGTVTALGSAIVGTTVYGFSAPTQEAIASGQRYKAISPAELLAKTGYDLKIGAVGTAVTAAAVKPAAQGQALASQAAAIPAPRPTLTAGMLGLALNQRADPAAPQNKQLYISAVQPGTPAAAAGFLPNDVVQRIGDIERPALAEFQRTVLLSPGRDVQIAVLRNGQPLVRTVKLGETKLAVPCLVIGLGNIPYEYAGACRDYLAHGQGELKYSLIEDGRSVAVTYSGDFAQGYMEGRGALKTAAHSYEGGFAANQRHGRGKLAYADGRPGFDGEFAGGEPLGLKAIPEAVLVCTRPDAAGNFRCDSPQRAALAGGPASKGKAESPQALLASVAQSCPSQRRLASPTHLVWGCGFAATNVAGAMDRGAGVEMRGRGTYQCLEREAACKRTELLSSRE
jgi:hypothetical protein